MRRVAIGLLSFGTVIAGGVSGCTSEVHESTGNGASALVGAGVAFDTTSPKNDTAVSFHIPGPNRAPGPLALTGPFFATGPLMTIHCSGTLISPRLVLTAAHCVNGDTNGGAPTVVPTSVIVVGLDYTNPAPPLASHRPIGSVTAHQGLVNPDVSSDDLALLVLSDYELANAWAFRPTLVLPRSSTSSCPTGALGCVGTYDALLGIAGFSNVSSPIPVTTRHVVQSTGLGIEAFQVVNWIEWGFPVLTTFNLTPGDSGGPLFVDRQVPLDRPGAYPGLTFRDSIGVNAAVNGSASRFADIVHEPNMSWLLKNVQYKTSPLAGPPHSAYWYATHNMTDEMWVGEVDYIGACDKVHDTDCDHWYDRGALGGRDNCPNTYNPDQADAFEFGAAAGTGDACRTCKFGDADGDGICDPCAADDSACNTAFAANPWHVDNCPKVQNSDQRNGNDLAERSNHADMIWGDACDPVPYVEPVARDREVNTNCVEVPNPPPYSNLTHFECTGTLVEDQITGTTVGAHNKNASGTSSVEFPVTVPESRERFCQSLLPNFNCARQDVVNDVELTLWPNEAAELGNDSGRPWHRVTTKWATKPPPNSVYTFSRDRLLGPWISGLDWP